MGNFKVGDMVVWKPFESPLLNLRIITENIFGIIVDRYESELIQSDEKIEILKIYWLTEDRIFKKYFTEIGPNWQEFITPVEDMDHG